MSNLYTYGIHEQFSPLAENSESLSVVEIGGKTLVIDCPDRSINSLILDDKIVSDSKMTHIDYLLITHIDSDHISGLAKVLWYKVFGENSKLNLIAHPKLKKALWRTLEGGFNQDRTKNVPSKRNFEDYVNFIPLKYGETLTIKGFGSIEAFYKPTLHSPNMDVLAVKVYNENHDNIANFSADTAFDPSLIEFLAKSGGPIIHEVGAYVEEGSHSHTSIKELIKKVSKDIQSRIFLNHIPAQREESIKKIINENGSPLRLADELYSDNVKKAILKAKESVGLNEIIYPGSFDPFTLGHLSLIKKHLSANKTDSITIMVAVNPDKKGMFSVDERIFLIEKSIPEDLKKRVKVISYEGVVADYMYSHNIKTVLKGVRDSKDFEYERNIAEASNRFSGEVNTVFLPQIDSSLTSVSSSGLKNLMYYGGNVKDFADPLVIEALRMKYTGKWIIGVTGSIGAGKTTFCNGLVEASKESELPVYYINMDKLGHEIHMRTDIPLFQKVRNDIAEKFGYWVLNSDGTTNRKKLGEFVFSSSKNLDSLMDIMLEPMLFLLRQKLFDLRKGDGIVLIEGAILTERRLTYLFDENMIDITIPKELQFERVAARDKLDKGQIERRLGSQLSNEDRPDIIGRNQASFYDRLYHKVDSDSYDASLEYEKLAKEFISRKNIIRGKN